MIPDDDGSASSDSSSDHSSLHVTSGPIMGGKGPGQLDWMNKFTKNINNSNTPSSSKQQPLPSNDGPAPAPERRVITRSSSFLRGEIEKPPQPEWMKKFQARNNNDNNNSPQNETSGTKERDRSPSPTRETIQNQFLPTAPTTPSWMKQYHKGPVGAGAPMIPSIPSLPSLSTGSSLSTTTTTSTATKSERITTKPDKATKPKKDWKALVNKSKAPVEQPPPPPPVVVEKPLPIAPPTPQWMNKFSGVGKGMPMAPKMDDDEDSEDDKSVSSVSSAISVEPEWMSQFNKVKSGMVIEPKKIKPPSNNKNKTEKTEEPEWIQKFQKRSSNPEATVPSPSPKTPGPEPEWMTRFREIGFREDGDEQMSPVRNNNYSKAPVNPSTTSPSPQFNNSFSNRNTPGKSTTTSSTAGSKVVNTPMSRSSFLPPLASPSTKTGKLSISAKLLTSSNGMLSAPSSPSSSGKLMVRGAGGGGISAPSSPVAGTGRASTVMSAVLTMSPGPPTLLRRGSMESTQPESKKVDPAAMAPEKPAWMNKVKAVAHSGKDEPEWMLKLKRTKQGITELGPEKGTPPWKIMDRMKAEQHQKLVNEVSISRLDYMHKSEGSMEDHSMNHSKLFDHEDSDDESQDEENIPEWMRQFKKMHLKEAEVLSYAQGRAPQGVSRLRRGSMQMIERSDNYNPAEEPARAIPIILKMPRKMSKRDIFGPTMDDSSSKEFDKSIGILETTSGKQDEAKTDDNKPQMVQGNAQVAQMQPKASTVVANSLPTGSAHGLPRKSSGQALSEDHPTDSKPAPASDAPSRFNNQVEIDNSQPENVMNMWGKKVKSKKPGNATLMSFRMIQNQAELVKERIARAKQKAEAGENAGVDSDEESIKDVETMTLSSTGGMDNSAAALFGAAKSGNTTKRTSVGLDNSAAALFGFGGGTVKRESVSMNNSAAALFGFANAHESSNSIGVDNVAERSKSINMDNSAAAMFGFGGAAQSSNNSATGDSSVSMNNSAAALFGITSGNDDEKAADQSQAKHGESAWAKGKSIAEEDSSDDDSSTEKKKGQGKEEKAKVIETKKSLLDDSSSDDSSIAGRKKQSQPVVTAKKSFLDDSDSDDGSDDDKPRTKVLPKSSKNDSDSDSDDEQPKKVSPTLTKKFSLDDSSSHDSPKKTVFTVNAKKDDSDSDESSDDEKPKSKATPAPIQAKKSFLDDSDSDNSDNEKPKTATKAISPTPVKKPLANDSDSDDSSNKSKPKQSPPKASPKSVPAKKSFLEDSDSDDSDDNEKVKPKKSAVLSPVKKATSDDSSDSSDDDKAKGKATASQAAGSKKKSFLDGSDSSDDSVGEERPKLVPMKLSTPAFAQPSTDKKKSSDDDSSSSSSEDSTVKRKQNTMAKIDTEKKIEDNKIIPMESNQGWDQTKIKQEMSSPMQNKDDFPTDNNDWDVGPSTNENDQDDEWQAALMELAAEEQAKKEKAEQDAWQAALMELAAEEKAKKEEAEQDAWQAALMQLAAEEESKKKNQNKDDAWDAALREFEEEEKAKEPDKAKATEKVTKPKTKAVDKKKTKDNDVVATTSKVGKKKNKDSDVDNDSNKKSPKNTDKEKETKNAAKEKETKVKKESKGVDTIAKAKEKNDRVPSKSPKPRKASLVVKESKKKGVDASPFDSSPFGASPFGASPFDAIGGPNDPSPFATLGGGAANDSPFAPLDQNSPFGPIGGSNGMSPFAPLGGNDKASKSPFAPLNDGTKTKKETKGLVVKNSPTKKPKSTMKLVVQTTKAKGDLHQKRTKKNGGGKEKVDDDDDDSFGNMVDFDDDFSIKNDFGDFAGEDGSVVPLRAVRNFGSKPTKGTTATTTMFSPKPPLHSNSKVKPNLLVKQADKVKEKKDSKSTEKEKEKKDKTRSRSKSKEKKLSRSHSESEAEDKKKSRSRSESVEKLKARSRSKSRSGRKGRSTSVSKEKKKESRDRSSSLGKGRQSKKKDKK